MDKNSRDQIQGDKINRQANITQGNYIEQQIIYENGVEIPKGLTTPPFIPEVFLGREKELTEIFQQLFSNQDNILLLVNGQGGVGKTSIASQYYHRYQSHYAHTAFVLSQKNITNALLDLARPLEVKFDPKWSSEQQLEVLIQNLANLKAPCLLIIDNANEVDDLDKNYQNLRRCSNFHLILTTRITKFSKAKFYPIKGLPEPDAVQLFKDHYEDHNKSEDDLLKEMISAAGNNTLVIELLAKNLQSLNEFETNYSLQNLLDDIQKNLTNLSQSQQIETIYQAKGTGLRNETPEAIILAMYDVNELNEAEKTLISNFAVLPAEKIEYTTLKSLLDSEQLDASLKSLSKKGWIEFHKEKNSKSFKVSPVVQGIVKVKHKKRILEDCENLIDTLVDKLKRDNLHYDNYQPAILLSHLSNSIIDFFNEPTYLLALLCERVGTLNTIIGNLGDALTFYERVRIVGKKLCEINPKDSDNKNLLAFSYSKLGETHSALGNLDNALKYFEQRSELGKQLFEAYPNNVAFKNGLAISYSKLGETHSALGNLDNALKYFEDETILFEQLFEAYPNNVAFKNGLAISYSKLGTFYKDKKQNNEKAKIYYLQCHQLWKELVEDFPSYAEFQNNFTWIENVLENL